MGNVRWRIAAAAVAVTAGVAVIGIATGGLTPTWAQVQNDPASRAPFNATRAPPLASFPAGQNGRTASRVDWQGAVGGLRRSGSAPDTLSTNLDRAKVDATRVPILLPNDPKLMAGARIYSFGDFYTITADAPGAGLSLTGTTAIIPLPAAQPLKVEATGPEGLTVQRTVDGQLASFLRYGVLYTVEIRCDRPSDPRCADDNYVLGLVGKTTAVLMGTAARAQAGLGG